MRKIEVHHMEEEQTVEVRKMTKAEAGRLGGLKKVKKGFAVRRDIAAEAGRIGGLTAQRRLREKKGA